ncbi:hypothetical protein N431DRAFT_501815 [Stipitochalara longipes BDJ]|nr:hypothetical protein N431DRAFT_501815 [Stipitochalara longipes BDJ]
MVFCGKPSKGCKHCRIRRIKCDQLDPACSQCLRAGKACPGYRDQLALLFRDESEKVVRKAKVPRNTPQHRKSSPGQSTSTRSSNCTQYTSPTSSVTPLSESHALAAPSPGSFLRSFSPRGLDEGVVFFFDHYVTINSNHLSGKIDLPQLPVLRLLFSNEAFNDAVSSVGYAGLSNVTKHPEYMIIARKKYAASLRSITLALKDTSKADLDTIFKSTMLLAAFEIVNGGAGSWGVHLDGGAAILNLLVAMQPPRMPPMRMQLQFVFTLYIKCMIEGEACPPNNVWAPHYKRAMSPHDAHATDLAYIVSRFTNLHASIRSKLQTDSDTKLREALLLDTMLEEWKLQLPQSWLYKLELHTEETAVMYKGVSHRYCDFWTARMYNHYRWCRILVNELLVTQLGPNSPENAAQRAKSLDIISREAADICSSVSIQFHKPTLLEETKQTGVPALTGCFLPLFHLAVAGSAMGVDDEMHNWVISMLELIGHDKGVAQALSMIPGTKLQREKWKLFSHGPADCSLLSGFQM